MIERIAVFDTETTGVDIENDRIVTAFFGVMDAQGKLVEERSWVIDNGIDIPEGAAEVHGWTTERVREHGRTDVARCIEEIVDCLAWAVAEEVPVVIYNARYDISIVDRESDRHGYYLLEIPHIIDPLVIDKQLDRFRKGSRKLADTAKHYGVPVGDAHDAREDCIMAGRLALALLQHRYLRPLAPVQIHERTQKYAAEQARGLRTYFQRAGKTEAAASVREEWPLIPRGSGS